MKNTASVVEKYGVLPVINITDVEQAEPLAAALVEGGLPLIEVTLRSACSLESIRAIRKAFPDMLIGAGTVLTTASVDEALEAGADYIVSPGYDPELVDYCHAKDVEIVPGCSTASEIQDAVKHGIKTVKFFPAELGGGVPAIKLLAGPFAGVKFLPTGGITLDNLEEYLSCDKVIACGGSFMANAAQLKAKDYDGITAACKKAVACSLGFRLAHIGINHESAVEAMATANAISSLFGFGTRECSSATFAGTVAECMNHSRFGTHGHIGISTHSITRAMAYLAAKGVEFDEDSIKRDKSGNITCIYFKEQIGGFAWHIVKD